MIPTAAPVAGDFCSIFFGLAVLSTDAVAVGATAVPDPVGEPQYPWIFWKLFAFGFASISADPSSAGASVRLQVDSRTMRKVKPREFLVWIVEYFGISGDPPMSAMVSTSRALLAE